MPTTLPERDHVRFRQSWGIQTNRTHTVVDDRRDTVLAMIHQTTPDKRGCLAAERQTSSASERRTSAHRHVWICELDCDRSLHGNTVEGRPVVRVKIGGRLSECCV